jgi:hypothetical protein
LYLRAVLLVMVAEVLMEVTLSLPETPKHSRHMEARVVDTPGPLPELAVRDQR